MYRKIYAFEILERLEDGLLINCTDRQRGETFFLNGMTVTDCLALIAEARADNTNRYDFFVYEKETENVSDSNEGNA